MMAPKMARTTSRQKVAGSKTFGCSCTCWFVIVVLEENCDAALRVSEKLRSSHRKRNAAPLGPVAARAGIDQSFLPNVWKCFIEP